MMPLELLPAVDLKSGVVSQSSSATRSEFTGTPAQVIDAFIAAGTRWIHLVDLDAAYGIGSNSELISNLVEVSKANFQISGGISNASVFNLFYTGSAQWINLSTASLLDLDWVSLILDKYADRVCVSLDVLNESLISRGSDLAVGDLSKYIKLLNQAGCKRFVVTDNQSDGKLSGPNFELLLKIKDKTEAKIIASGGVSNLSDLSRLRQIGLDGVIVGRALYDGQIIFSDALDTCYK